MRLRYNGATSNKERRYDTKMKFHVNSNAERTPSTHEIAHAHSVQDMDVAWLRETRVDMGRFQVVYPHPVIPFSQFVCTQLCSRIFASQTQSETPVLLQERHCPYMHPTSDIQCCVRLQWEVTSGH